jgi:hypothetical protein
MLSHSSLPFSIVRSSRLARVDAKPFGAQSTFSTVGFGRGGSFDIGGTGGFDRWNNDDDGDDGLPPDDNNNSSGSSSGDSRVLLYMLLGTILAGAAFVFSMILPRSSGYAPVSNDKLEPPFIEVPVDNLKPSSQVAYPLNNFDLNLDEDDK